MRAQPQPPVTTSQPSFRAAANFVRVDVYPTVKGLPVRDLTAADFELFEDGAPQAVTQFERVDISTITTRDERRDPGRVSDGKAQAADPRRRVFVLYLDTWHTTAAGAERARQPLIDMLERLVGPDDSSLW